MRIRIQKSMILSITLTLVISYALLSILIYNQNLTFLKNSVRQEGKYISASIELLGIDYLRQMDNVNPDIRVTQIAPDGRVLYDSGGKESTLGLHNDRVEVQDALAGQTGEDVRTSKTTGHRMYYYAQLMNDGTIIRVSRTMDNLVNIALSILPAICVLFVIMMVFAWLLAKWQTARLIKPINELDIEHPLENKTYDELIPLLQAIDRQNTEKDAVSNMRREFSANVSHELKTPLTSISGYAEIMMNGMVRQEDIPKFSERIYKEAKRLITLIEDNIKLSQLDEERIDMEKEDVDLYELCREIISRLAPQAEAGKIQVSVTGEPVVYHGVRQVLDEMVYNLCENAIKYNSEGGRVEIWVGKTLEGIKISVIDTGIGIARADYERIFERFYRVDKSHSKETGGTGLGLSIVKHGALFHGAKINVKSELGKGTRIDLKF